MPVCKKCEGAGTVVATPDGATLPFYKAVMKPGGAVMECDRCEGWGRVDDDGSAIGSKTRVKSE